MTETWTAKDEKMLKDLRAKKARYRAQPKVLTPTAAKRVATRQKNAKAKRDASSKQVAELFDAIRGSSRRGN